MNGFVSGITRLTFGEDSGTSLRGKCRSILGYRMRRRFGRNGMQGRSETGTMCRIWINFPRINPSFRASLCTRAPVNVSTYSTAGGGRADSCQCLPSNANKPLSCFWNSAYLGFFPRTIDLFGLSARPIDLVGHQSSIHQPIYPIPINVSLKASHEPQHRGSFSCSHRTASSTPRPASTRSFRPARGARRPARRRNGGYGSC